MTDRPIIFSGPMVRALLAGRKTMTRRLAWAPCDTCGGKGGTCRGPHKPSPWQRAKPGGRLWVRESIKQYDDSAWFYAADQTPIELSADNPKVAAMVAWAHHQERDYAPSIHMPRMFSRLTLIVSTVKIERLQKIGNADAFAEGIERREPFPVESFKALWGSLHGSGAWDTNPEVVALTFTVHQQNLDAQVAA